MVVFSDRSRLAVVLIVYLVTLFLVGSLSFEEGYHSGLRDLCPFGDLNLYEGVVVCDLPVNNSGFLEVLYYGGY